MFSSTVAELNRVIEAQRKEIFILQEQLRECEFEIEAQNQMLDYLGIKD